MRREKSHRSDLLSCRRWSTLKNEILPCSIESMKSIYIASSGPIFRVGYAHRVDPAISRFKAREGKAGDGDWTSLPSTRKAKEATLPEEASQKWIWELAFPPDSIIPKEKLTIKSTQYSLPRGQTNQPESLAWNDSGSEWKSFFLYDSSIQGVLA